MTFAFQHCLPYLASAQYFNLKIKNGQGDRDMATDFALIVFGILKPHCAPTERSRLLVFNIVNDLCEFREQMETY